MVQRQPGTIRTPRRVDLPLEALVGELFLDHPGIRPVLLSKEKNRPLAWRPVWGAPRLPVGPQDHGPGPQAKVPAPAADALLQDPPENTGRRRKLGKRRVDVFVLRQHAEVPWRWRTAPRGPRRVPLVERAKSLLQERSDL